MSADGGQRTAESALGVCAAEPPRLGWGRLVRALRLLELSGEIVSGHFEPAFEVFDELVPVTVEEIDGAPAARSPHAAAFVAHGFERDMDRLVRRRRYG